MSRPLALILLLAVSPAGAKCLGRDADSDPATAAAFKACQDREHAAYARSKPGDAKLEAFEDKQRADAGVYFGRHTQDGSEESAPPAAAEETPAPRAKTRATSGSGQGAPDGSMERSSGASPAELDALKAAMLQKSDGGKKGITPDMADDMRRFILQKQGGVSPDMQALLDATAKDGPNLTQDTMEKLRGAGKSAKGAGLDLGIDPKIEKALLEDDLSPAPGAATPGTN